MSVVVARVYDAGAAGGGHRVLVDRLWPRGVARAALAHDEWAKDLAPSDALRRWYGHDPARFAEFARRYRAELDAPGDPPGAGGVGPARRAGTGDAAHGDPRRGALGRGGAARRDRGAAPAGGPLLLVTARGALRARGRRRAR